MTDDERKEIATLAALCNAHEELALKLSIGMRRPEAAEIVETGDERIPYLVAAPTMRVPMVLHESVNAYMAVRAVLLLVRHGVFRAGQHQGQPVADHVRTVAFPRMGTGVGRIGANTCARQMRAAFADVLFGQYSMPQSWAEASERRQLLYTDRPRRLQY